MKVHVEKPAVAAIRTLDLRAKRKVNKVLGSFANATDVARLKRTAKASPQEGVFYRDAAKDIRVYYTLDAKNQGVSVVSIAKPSLYATSGSEAE